MKRTMAVLLAFVISLGFGAAVYAADGEWAIEPVYDGAMPFSEGLAAVILDGKWGYIDKTGSVVIPGTYEVYGDGDWNPYYGAGAFTDGLAVVMLDGKYGAIDKDNNAAVPFEYDIMSDYSNGLAAVMADGKFGFIDKEGNEVIPLKYDSVSSFSGGLAAVQLGGKHGFIDKDGNEVIPLDFDSVGSFTGGLAAIQQDGKYGYIDINGDVVITPEYDRANAFSESLASVQSDGKWGFIDKEGNAVIPFEYNRAFSFSGGYAAVLSADMEWGYINKENGEALSFGTYGNAGSFIGGYAVATTGMSGSGARIIDTAFNEVIVLPENALNVSLSNGMALVETTDGMYGYIALPKITGWERAFDLEVVDAFGGLQVFGSFSEGLAWHFKPTETGNMDGVEYIDYGEFGYINTSGEVVIPYMDMGAFHIAYLPGDFYEGLAKFYKDGKWGYIDMTGETVIPFEYDGANNFMNDMAYVWKGLLDAEELFIDKSGNAVQGNFDVLLAASNSAMQERSIKNSADAPTPFQSEGKYGYQDADGNTLIEAQFEYAGPVSENMAVVKSDGEYFYIRFTIE